MDFSRISAFVVVALAAAAVTYFVVSPGGGGRCDIHPHLTDKGLAALKANVGRARDAAHDAAMTDKKGTDQANREGEDAALENFVYNLHDAVGDEYLRHRRALDGCF